MPTLYSLALRTLLLYFTLMMDREVGRRMATFTVTPVRMLWGSAQQVAPASGGKKVDMLTSKALCVGLLVAVDGGLLCVLHCVWSVGVYRYCLEDQKSVIRMTSCGCLLKA